MTTLVQIKLLHTAVWFFFAGCIVAIPVVGGLGHYVWAAVLSGFVLAECGVLAAYRGRCPLNGHGSTSHQAALGELRYLFARVAG